MKLIKQKVERWDQGDGLNAIYEHIARCTRVCYQSEAKEGESGKEFLDRVVFRNKDQNIYELEADSTKHFSVLEHGTIYLTMPFRSMTEDDVIDVLNNYSEINLDAEYKNYYITTNLRVLIEKKLLHLLKYLTPPSYHHERRTTFSFITDIGTSRELNRHRCHSVSEESTRYCNYASIKNNNEVTFIIPIWLDIPEGRYIRSHMNTELFDEEAFTFPKIGSDAKSFLLHLGECEENYIKFHDCFEWKPQLCRELLPLATKTQVIHTAFNKDWDTFFKLRMEESSGKVHPNMKQLATLAYDVWKK